MQYVLFILICVASLVLMKKIRRAMRNRRKIGLKEAKLTYEPARIDPKNIKIMYTPPELIEAGKEVAEMRAKQRLAERKGKI